MSIFSLSKLSRRDLIELASTGEEHRMFGSNLPPELDVQDVPLGVLKGEITKEEAVVVRKELLGGHFESGTVGSDLDFSGMASIRYRPLDPVTSKTAGQWEILGEWDRENERVILYPGRDLISEFREIARKGEYGLSFLDAPVQPSEGTPPVV